MDPREQLIGYTDSPAFTGGEPVAVRVSSSAAFTAELVELLHSDADPAGPGPLERVIDAVAPVTGATGLHTIQAGSYAVASGVCPTSALTMAAWVYPTQPDARRQVIMARWRGPLRGGSGVWLGLDTDGCLRLEVAPGGVVSTTRPLPAREWTFVLGGADLTKGRCVVGAAPARAGLADEEQIASLPDADRAGVLDADVTLAGLMLDGAPAHTFDGKLDAPVILRGVHLLGAAACTDPAERLAAWDGTVDPSSSRWHGVVGTPDAELVNLPTRAVTGYNWNGDELAWRHAPEQYGAVHFHTDDLEDARWPIGAKLPLPPKLDPGVYAVRLRAQTGAEDRVPVIVRGRRPRGPLAVLLPTLTYLAYAAEPIAPEFEAALESHGDHYVTATGLLSQYSHHKDGSGVVHASWRRPLPTYRADYRYWLTGKPHGLGADLYLLHWLRCRGTKFDLLTDDDLERDGTRVLDPYRVVITGSHPEYVTRRELLALHSWLDRGRRLMYLGGNGFTMVTGVDPKRPHASEIRRTGSRAGLWESDPGESHLSTTGEAGGHWAQRRERPRELVGVESVAMGFHGGRSYRRMPDSFLPRAAFVFAGVGDDEPIGDDALGFGGAAAYETDGWDRQKGTPCDALLLARADRLPAGYVPLTSDPYLRADMVLLERPGGGMVFSTGSIAWTAGLSARSGSNPVARITANVLERFLDS